MNKDALVFYGIVILSLCFVMGGCVSSKSSEFGYEMVPTEYDAGFQVDITGGLESDDIVASIAKKQKIPFTK